MDHSQPIAGSKESREQKRRKQRESLNNALGDPFIGFSVPDVVRKHSAEVDRAAQNIEERVRSVSAKSREAVESTNENQAREYVESRERLADEATFLLKMSKIVVGNLRHDKVLDRPSAKRAHKELDDCDKAILQERAVLAANRVKVRYGILSHPSHARIGEAYLSAIMESLPELAGARLRKQGARESSDQSSFRRRALTFYNLLGYDSNPNLVESWCPISKMMLPAEHVTAAHIVPYAIGEVNAAYLFGLDVEEGYQAIWSIKNSLPMQSKIEKAMNAAQVIIVPDDEDPSELKLVVLDDSILDHILPHGRATFRDLNQRRLVFQTKTRPARRSLYLHHVLTLFRRKRFDVEGWENDHKKVKSSFLWASPGKWIRRSIIKAIAFELGDVERVEDITGEDNGLADFPNEVSSEKEANIAIGIRHALEVSEDEIEEM